MEGEAGGARGSSSVSVSLRGKRQKAGERSNMRSVVPEATRGGGAAGRAPRGVFHCSCW